MKTTNNAQHVPASLSEGRITPTFKRQAIRKAYDNCTAIKQFLEAVSPINSKSSELAELLQKSLSEDLQRDVATFEGLRDTVVEANGRYVRPSLRAILLWCMDAESADDAWYQQGLYNLIKRFAERGPICPDCKTPIAIGQVHTAMNPEEMDGKRICMVEDDAALRGTEQPPFVHYDSTGDGRFAIWVGPVFCGYEKDEEHAAKKIEALRAAIAEKVVKDKESESRTHLEKCRAEIHDLQKGTGMPPFTGSSDFRKDRL